MDIVYDSPSWYNIVGIDPGNNLGISVLSVDIETNSIVNIDSMTYVLSNYVEEDSFNSLLDRCCKLQDIVSNVISAYRPVFLGIEAAFMNSRFPKSVMQLSQYVGTIELAVRNTDPWVRMMKYPPKYVKSQCGAGGEANKLDMMSNLKRIPEIANMIHLDGLTEHAIDSIAIAYVSLQMIREQPYLLYTLPF